MSDLSTTYLGLSLKNPLVVSASPLTEDIENIKKMEAAGADALELNIYFLPTDPLMPGEKLERIYLDLVQAVKRRLRIPLAVKIGPYFSSTIYMARRFEQAGADALVLFNRFYQPDFDL